jgi:thiamine kinase-like enzyme
MLEPAYVPILKAQTAETFSQSLDSNPSVESVQDLFKIFGHVLKITKINGALTNSVYKVLLSDKCLLLRIYGLDSDIFIDRSFEVNCFLIMSELGLGPKCLATFSNGRIEEFLDAETLSSKSLFLNYPQIAASLAHLHNIPCERSVMLWDRLNNWHSLAVNAVDKLERLGIFKFQEVDLKSVGIFKVLIKRC